MNTSDLHNYIEQWMQNVFKYADLMEHEKQLICAMIELLPKPEEEQEDLFIDDPDLVTAGKIRLTETGDCIITSKKKKLKGADLEKFLLFWNAFDYKKSRAEAAQAWLDIPDTKNKEFMDHILYAARQCASERKPTITPKMAQGWISARRWEDYDMQNALPDQWTPEKWRKSLTPYMQRNRAWPEYMPGPNPWDHKNTEIPGAIYELYADEWGWK